MIAAVTMVKDEADIIGPVLEHLYAEGIDHIIVADNNSTDGTSDILAGLAGRFPLTVVPDPEPAYYQAAKMTALAHQAHGIGADWVLPFDADEVFHAPAGTLAQSFAAVPDDVDTIAARGWDHIATTPQTFSPYRRRQHQPLPKAAFRARDDVELAMGNHAVTPATNIVQGPLLYRHFQYRSPEQMARKLRNGAAAYRLTDLPATEGAHWRVADSLNDEDLAARWDALADEQSLIFDPPPLRRPCDEADVTIVIPTWNRADLLDRCLTATVETAPAAQVIVVDNGSTDNTADILARHPVDTIVFDENRGFVPACNEAAAKARGRRLVFLNNDTVPMPGWLTPLVTRTGIAGSHLVYPDGKIQHSGVFFRRRDGLLEAFNRTDPAASGPVPAVTGACLSIDADTFNHLGRFDDGYVNGYEDVALCLTAQSQRVPVWFEAGSVVVHLESQTPGRFDAAQANVARLQQQWGHLTV